MQNIRYESSAYVPEPGRWEMGVEGYLAFLLGERLGCSVWAADLRGVFKSGGSSTYAALIEISRDARTLCRPSIASMGTRSSGNATICGIKGL